MGEWMGGIYREASIMSWVGGLWAVVYGELRRGQRGRSGTGQQVGRVYKYRKMG